MGQGTHGAVVPANTAAAARGVGGFLWEEDSGNREDTTIVWKDLMNVKPLGIIVRGLSPMIVLPVWLCFVLQLWSLILIPSGRKACKMSAFQRGRGILPLMQALLSVLHSPSDSPLLLPCARAYWQRRGRLADVNISLGWALMRCFSVPSRKAIYT